MKKTFKEKVLEVVGRIPKGKTMTYKEVATKAGNRGGPAAKKALLKKEGAIK